jgi:hypothetical protein
MTSYGPEIEAVNIINIILCQLSTVCSLSVVFILCYKYSKLVRGKSLVHLVLMIAISDSLVSFSLGFGYPLSYGSYGLCYFQGFVSLLFERTSWMFTLFLMINSFGIIVLKRYIYESNTPIS